MKTWKRTFFEAGKRYGRLTTVEEVKEGINIRWRCVCDCGQEVSPVKHNLLSGATRSCGCLNIESAHKRTKHGLCRSKEFGGPSDLHTAHTSMMTRCYNPNATEYARYGGRGIRVVERWHDVKNFVDDMGEKPSKNHSLDRIDNSKDYGPDNCRWATDQEQSNNRRSNRIIEHQGTRLTVAQWARVVGLKHFTLSNRLSLGWNIGRALTEPVHQRS